MSSTFDVITTLYVQEIYFFTHLKIIYLYENDRLYFHGFVERDWIPSTYVSKEQLKANVGELIILIAFEP
jgi:hypothetical protein